MTKKKNPRIGSSADDMWQELGILEDITATAIKRTIAMQIENEMSSQNISKAEMARRMRTSASQLERILDPDNQRVQLDSLVKAAHAVGKELSVALH